MKTPKLLLLFLALPAALLTACGGGGGGGGTPTVSATLSTVVAEVPFGGLADGIDPITITVTVLDTQGNPLSGQSVQLSGSGLGLSFVQPSGRTNGAGRIQGTVRSTIPGPKTLRATVNPGPDAVALQAEATTEFIRIARDTRYVRTGGSDSNTGTNPRQAWRTIAFALSQLSPGDTLFIGAGTYPEVLDLPIGGSSGNPLVLRGDREGCYTGDAGEVLIDALGASWALRVHDVSHVVVRGLTLTGAAPGNGSGGGLLVDGNATTDVWLVENRVFGNDRGVSVEGARRVHLESNRISNNLGTPGDGLRLVGTVDTNVVHNLIYNNGRYGIWLEDAVDTFLVDLSTLYRNADDQVREDGAGSSGTIKNSVVTEGLADGISLVSGSAVTLSTTLIWGNVDEDVRADSTPPGGSADPEFLDPSGPDGQLGGLEGSDDVFLLAATSPAIDAGDASASVRRLLFGAALAGYTSRGDGLLEGAGSDQLTLNLGLHQRAASLPFGALGPDEGRVLFAPPGRVQVEGRSRSADGTGWSTEGRSETLNYDVRWIANAVSPLGNGEEIFAVLTDDGTATELFARVWDGRKWSEDDPFAPVIDVIDSADAGQRGFDVAFEGLSGEALFAYTDGGPNPVFRVWSEGEWGADQPVYTNPSGTGSVLWVQLVPRPGTNEIALIALDDQERLTAGVWDGQAWEAAPTLLGAQMSTTRDAKPFDAAYESLSGDLLVLWGHTVIVEETRFATRSATTQSWTLGQQGSTDAHGVVVRLAADPASDQIVAGVAEGPYGDDTVGMIWTGDAWVHIAELDLSSVANQRDLAVGWVGNSGRAVLVYGDDDGAGLDWGAWTTGGWKRQTDANLSGVGELVFAEARSLPNQDGFFVVLADADGELHALRLVGDTWTVENGGAPLATGLDVSGTAKPFAFDRLDG